MSCDDAYFGLHPSSDPLQLHLFNPTTIYPNKTVLENRKTNKMKPYIGIPLVVGLVYRAWSRKSLTPLGLVVAGCSASAHALHPWSAPVALLAVFYFGGTKVTKVWSYPYVERSCKPSNLQPTFMLWPQLTKSQSQVKHEIKSRLTLSATGAEGGEGSRNHIQVLANSVVATVLSIAHAIVLAKTTNTESCFSLGQNAADVLMVGIVAYVSPVHIPYLDCLF
jgi:uncharacterized membrane protein